MAGNGKDRALYASRIPPRNATPAHHEGEYGRVINGSFHYTDGPSAVYGHPRKANLPVPEDGVVVVNKPLVSLDVNIDVSPDKRRRIVRSK